MNLIFLIPSQTIRTDSKKSIKSVVGGQERIDVISRCFLNLSRWNIRSNAKFTFIFYLSHPKEQMKFSINLAKTEHEIENELDSTRELIKILSNKQNFEVEVEKTSFEVLLKTLAKRSMIYYLTPDGLSMEDLEKQIKEKDSLCFVLGSQYDLTQEQEEVLLNLGAIPMSVGKQNYLASHVITIVCHNLHTMHDILKQ